jgi:excisionase family DNA binding protein
MTEPTHEWLTTKEVADIIRKDRDYVARQCANGALKAKTLGNDWRIHQTSVDAFMWGLTPAPTRRRSRAS